MLSRARKYKNNKEKGDFLQNITASIERVLSGDQNVSITSPEFIADLSTGAPVEHDIVIRHSNHHRPVLTSIECKNRKNAVSVPHIRDFAAKCRDSGVHNAVFVSTSGYTGPARDRARIDNVLLLDLADAIAFDWSKQIVFVKYAMNWRRPKLAVYCKTTPPTGEFNIYDQTGSEIAKDDVRNILENHVPKPEKPEDWVGKEYPVRVIIQMPGAYILDCFNRRTQVDHLVVEARPIVERYEVDTELMTYGAKEDAFEIASTPFDLNGVSGDMLMVRTEPDTIQLWWHKRGKVYPSPRPARRTKRANRKP